MVERNNPSLIFNKTLFLNYYFISLEGGDLSRSGFYSAIKDNKVFNDMLGVRPDTTKVDLETFYENWNSISKIETYTTEVRSYLSIAGKKFTVNYSVMKTMSSFIIQFYFFFKKSPSDFTPRIVDETKPGYYIQTVFLKEFFKNQFVRGSGNPTIKGLCESALEIYPTVDAKRTAVSKSENLIGWCGCFSPLDPILNLEEFTSECDPLCVNLESIKLVDATGIESGCNSAVCVLTNVTLNTEGTLGGNFSFEQICNACSDNSDQPCRCVIDSSVASILTKIEAKDTDGRSSGMDVEKTFKQYCPNSICLIVDNENDKIETVECNEFNPAATGLGDTNLGTGNTSYTFSNTISFTDTSGLLCFFLAIILIFLCFSTFLSSKTVIKTQ